MSDKLTKNEEAVLDMITTYTKETRDTVKSITGYNIKPYCTQNNGDCESCSLSNYGKDCHNKPINTKDVRIGLRLDAETHKACQQLAPEGNISMWIRSLIRKEIESNKK